MSEELISSGMSDIFKKIEEKIEKVKKDKEKEKEDGASPHNETEG